MAGRGHGGRLPRALSYALLLVGLVGLAVPVVTELRTSWVTEQGISEIEATYSDMEDHDRSELLRQAEEYNRAILSATSTDGLLPYRQQLAYGGIDMIAHLSIPKLALNLPIYHDTDDDTLMTGVGHLEGTTLPVGTVGGRCVLAGHSGMPNARMFDDIHLLGIGDRFVIWTLGQALAYEVTETKVVWPEETDELLPVPGEDLVTLVTCTPYGTNTHRLLVTGRRCAYVPDEEEIPDAEVYVNRRTIPLLAAFGTICLTTLICVAIRAVRHARRGKAGASQVAYGSRVAGRPGRGRRDR